MEKQWLSAKAQLTEKTIIGVASDETTDRQGDIILATAWQLDNFLKNPVLLWAHDYKSPPVGKVLRIWVENGRLMFEVEFAPTEFAQEVRQLYEQGFLNTFSVGFLPLEYDYNEKTGGYIYKKVELLEISAVPVPANPNAVVLLRSKGLLPDADTNPAQKGGEEMEPEVKGVIPYRKTPLAPENTPWDAAAEVKKATVEDLKVMCAWYDDANPDVKQAYKLPHHKADGKYSCVWRGVAAAMAALFGARGGVKIPEKDKKGVYQHLAKHYEDFGKTPPEWGKAWDEVKAEFDFLTDAEIDAVIRLWDDAETTEQTEPNPEDVVEWPKDDEETAETEKTAENAEPVEKVGAVLSRKNAEKLMALANKVADAISVLDEAVQELVDFVESATRRAQDDDNTDGEKLYTEEEVRQLVEDAVKTALDAYRKALWGGEEPDA